MYRVTRQSDSYGFEQFDCDSANKALRKLNTLVKQSLKSMASLQAHGCFEKPDQFTIDKF